MSSSEIIDVECNNNNCKNCAVKLGRVYCDGLSDKGAIGCFTHFHHDHTSSVEDCIGQYDRIITHHITLKALSVNYEGIDLRDNWVTQEYGDKFNSKDGDEITLLLANHIPGSAQVHVQTNETSMIYSGDFSFPEMTTRHAEYMVLDSTHGEPSYNGKTDRKFVKNDMFERVNDYIDKKQKPIIIMANSGTLEEIIKHFESGTDKNRMSHDIPFATTKKHKDTLHAIYKNESRDFRDILTTDGDEQREFWSLVRGRKRCVIFMGYNDPIDSSLSSLYTVRVDRYRFRSDDSPIILHDNGIRYNLAAHASFEDIIKYVNEVKPKTIITDRSRSGFALDLAEQLKIKFPEKEILSRPNCDD